jgi:hypothetical protein
MLVSTLLNQRLTFATAYLESDRVQTFSTDHETNPLVAYLFRQTRRANPAQTYGLVARLHLQPNGTLLQVH